MRDGTRLKILARGIQSRKDDWGYLCVSKKWRSKCLCSGHELCSQREGRVFLLLFLKREEQRGKEQAVFDLKQTVTVSLQICMVLNCCHISSQEPYKHPNVDSVIYVTFKLLLPQLHRSNLRAWCDFLPSHRLFEGIHWLMVLSSWFHDLLA